LGINIAYEGKSPKITQLLSLLLTITYDKGIILEVKTGEGKTMILAMIALYYCLFGCKVAIITSS